MANENKLDVKLLPVTTLATLGICQHKFIEALTSNQFKTPLMNIGIKEHEKLAAKSVPTETEYLLKHIKSGEKFTVREFGLIDATLKVVGRIDELEFMGPDATGKNQLIIVDDKFPEKVPKDISNYYKIQLAAYANIVSDSKVFGKLCNICGAELRVRKPGTGEIIKKFEIDKDNFIRLSNNIAPLTYAAWELIEGNDKPQHKKYDIEIDDWVECDHR